MCVQDQCTGQIIDIGGVWEIKCPQGCTCEIQKFSDLPLHQWADTSRDKSQVRMNRNIDRSTRIHFRNCIRQSTFDDGDFNMNDYHSMTNELLKSATCVIVKDPEELLAKLPTDIQVCAQGAYNFTHLYLILIFTFQVLTLLESGSGDVDILLQATAFQHMTELISLDIQGIDYSDTSSMKEASKRKARGGIVLSSDTMHSLGPTLLYLNLERIKLSNLNARNKDKANLVIKPMNSPTSETIDDSQAPVSNASQHKGHRLIFLSQKNSEDKEILPYDLYKQELEGYRENVELFAALGVLTHLRVYDCALKDISWHMFDGLNSLLYLSLEKNSLKFIPEFCFYGTPNLRLLSLASNELLTLKSVDLAGLLTLEHLDLRGNNLTFLSELSFPPFPALISADFTDNPVDSVFPR